MESAEPIVHRAIVEETETRSPRRPMRMLPGIDVRFSNARVRVDVVGLRAMDRA